MLLDTKLYAGGVSRHVVTGVWDFNKLTGIVGMEWCQALCQFLFISSPIHLSVCIGYWGADHGGPHKSTCEMLYALRALILKLWVLTPLRRRWLDNSFMGVT